MRPSSVSALLLLLVLMAAPPARAQEPDLLGEHGAWRAWQGEESGGRVCFMTSEPTGSEGGGNRGPTMIRIAHRPTENSWDVLSVVAGFTYEERSFVTLTIGAQEFKLFTQGGRAWSYPADDARIAQAIRAGNTLRLVSTSSRGNRISDTYSLSGSSAAHAAIDQACGRR